MICSGMSYARNRLRKLQTEIGAIFDDFIESMRHSPVKVEVESFLGVNACRVRVKIYKCRSCDRYFIKSTLQIANNRDIKHLAKFLDGIYSQWRLFHPSNDNTSSSTD